jgi:phage I-like protein
MPRTALPQGQLAAALAVVLDDPAGMPEGCNVHLFPDGAFASDDGRPGKLTRGLLEHWRMDAAIAAALSATVSAQKPLLYDYDHDSANGGSSRAAGWIEALSYVPGKGLYARVAWTPVASEAINCKEYRYSSPYFYFDAKSGAVTRLVSVALTNTPALTDLSAVGLRITDPDLEKENNDMPQQRIIAGQEHDLGTAKALIASLTTERDAARTQLASLTAERDAAVQKLAGIEEAARQAALAKEKEERAALLETIPPALRGSLESMSLAALKDYTEKAVSLGLLKPQATGKDAPAAQLSQEEAVFCAKLGVTHEAFLKAKE